VAALLKVYGSRVDGEDQIMNGRIESALGAGGGDGTLSTAADSHDRERGIGSWSGRNRSAGGLA
jgi:hypothetical protein